MTQVEIDLGRVYDKLSPQMITRGKRILANQAMSDNMLNSIFFKM